MIQRTDSESRNRQLAAQRESARRRRSRTQRRRLLMEGLESRQLLAFDLPDLDPDFLQLSDPRNIGTVPSFIVNEVELTNSGANDVLQNAQFLPLGTGANQEDTVDVNGSMGFTVSGTNVSVDIDTYSFDLRGGDILDLAVLGSGSNFTVFHPDGRVWFGTDTNTGAIGYPAGSPLQTLGNATGAQVTPVDGRYFVQLAPSFGSVNYTLGLRTYRPTIERAPIGASQVVYLDFDGGIFSTFDFGNTAGLATGRRSIQRPGGKPRDHRFCQCNRC